jgi:predicted nucleic acid-binding protein
VNTAKRYLIDSNVLIEAHRRYYGFDVCPGFWDSVVWHHGQDHLLSLDKVREELDEEQDVLNQWAKTSMPASGFATSNEPAVVDLFGKLQVWAQAQTQFTAAARQEFATVADAWLVAYAKAHDLVLVTHEEYRPDAKKRIPIPNVCKAFDVQHTNTFDMLRALAVKYHWTSPS